MPSERDGGIWALGGYLYQTIGLLGISAFISNLNEGSPSDPGANLDLLIKLIDVHGAITIHSEAFNQDALLHACGLDLNDKAVLIQFKYSVQVPPPTIGPADVKEIIDTFEESVRRANASGENVTACVLITNRRFAQGVGSGGQLWENEKNNSTRAYQLREIVELSAGSFRRELEHFAMARGATEPEINAGIQRLIGQVLTQTVERTISSNTLEETLNEAFTGYRYARPISAAALSDTCQDSLREFARNLRIDAWGFFPVTRELYQEVYNLAQQRALIGLCGHGGYGKSVLLWQLLSSNSTPIRAICEAIHLRTAWISYLVNHAYRQLPEDRASEPYEQAIARLSIANQGSPRPILWLGLDGLDEVAESDQKNIVREILNWFWEKDKRGSQAEAVLIATFRSPDQLKNSLSYPHDYPGRTPPILNVDQFSKKELVQAFQKMFPDVINTELSVPFSDVVGSPYSVERDDYVLLQQKVAASILPSLHHPVVWRALLNLPPEARSSALLGQQETLDQLALDLIRWFKDKLDRKPLLTLDEARLLLLLSTIAQNKTFETVCSNNDWLGPSQDVCGSDAIAYAFLKEAELTGLIAIDSDKTWHWKHAFVHNFLTRQG